VFFHICFPIDKKNEKIVSGIIYPPSLFL